VTALCGCTVAPSKLPPAPRSTGTAQQTNGASNASARTADARGASTGESASEGAGASIISGVTRLWRAWRDPKSKTVSLPAPAPRLTFAPPPASDLALLARSSASMGQPGADFSAPPAASARFDSGFDLGSGLGELSLFALPGLASAPAFPTARPISFSSGGASSGSSGGVGIVMSGGGTVVSSWRAQQERARAQQARSIEEMALRVAGQRQAARGEQEELLRAALRDDLERVGRLDLDALTPALLSPERALQLANLRLKLLAPLAVAPARQEQADRERRAIETELRALLRAQELEQRALLEKLRREIPSRLQTRRVAAITRALEQLRQSDSDAIATLLRGQQARLSRDFSDPARLGIAFGGSARTSISNPSRAQTAISFDENYLRTNASGSASFGPIASPSSFALPRTLSNFSAAGAEAGVPEALPPRGASGATLSQERAQSQARAWRALLARRARAWKVRVR
jgi:hypothetical protein